MGRRQGRRSTLARHLPAPLGKAEDVTHAWVRSAQRPRLCWHPFFHALHPIITKPSSGLHAVTISSKRPTVASKTRCHSISSQHTRQPSSYLSVRGQSVLYTSSASHLIQLPSSVVVPTISQPSVHWADAAAHHISRSLSSHHFCLPALHRLAAHCSSLNHGHH